MALVRRTGWTAAWVIAVTLAMCGPGTGRAATFSLVYDDTPDAQIGNIVGTGTFSYNGPAVIGSFGPRPSQELTWLS